MNNLQHATSFILPYNTVLNSKNERLHRILGVLVDFKVCNIQTRVSSTEV